MKKCIFLFFLSSLFGSCKVDGDFKGLYSHYKTTKSENPELFAKPKTGEKIYTIAVTAKPRIIVTNGNAIKECLQVCDNALVYIWSPKCTSQYCYSLNALQRECLNRGIELFIVAEYYDSEKMLQNYSIRRPIYGIDIQFYKTSLTSKYISRFIYDLSGKKKVSGRLLRFKNGFLVNSGDRFESI